MDRAGMRVQTKVARCGAQKAPFLPPGLQFPWEGGPSRQSGSSTVCWEHVLKAREGHRQSARVTESQGGSSLRRSPSPLHSAHPQPSAAGSCMFLKISSGHPAASAAHSSPSREDSYMCPQVGPALTGPWGRLLPQHHLSR